MLLLRAYPGPRGGAVVKSERSTPASARPRNYRKQVYDSYASAFNERPNMAFDFDLAARRTRAYQYFLRGWLPKKNDAVIADVGCGDGTMIHFFHTMGYRNVNGVDISAEQVEIARQVCPDVVHGSAHAFLEARPEQFDLVIALDLIEHFRKDEVMRFLAACRNALRPGGALIMQTPNAEAPWGGSLRYGDFTHEVAFTPACLARLQKLHGFVQVEAREVGPIPFGYSFKSTVRTAAWSGLRLLARLYSLVETGSSGSGILTRVFLTAACKQGEAA